MLEIRLVLDFILSLKYWKLFLICYDIMFQSLAYFSWTIVSTDTWTPTQASQKDVGPQGRPATRWTKRTTGAQEVGKKLLPGLVSFFRQFYLICSITSWRLCSFTLVFPTSWKKILFQDDDAACFDDMILFIWFRQILSAFSFSLPPCEPSSRAGSTWQGAWSSSQEQGLRLFPSFGIFPPLSCSHWSAWPPFQDGTSHKLSSLGRIVASTASGTDLDVMISDKLLVGSPFQRGVPFEV